MRQFLFAVLLASGFASDVSAADLPSLDLVPHGGPVLRFAVTGDTGEGAATVAEGIRRVNNEKALDAILLAGDNFYPCGVTSESDTRWSLVLPLTRIGPPVLPVLGNHDYCAKADPDAQIRASGTIANWRFPARQYVVHAGPGDFAFLDTTPYVSRGSSHAETFVREAFHGSKSAWRIVVGHHPVVSSGYHGYFPRVHVLRMRELLPALRESRVDLYVCGHDHHTELIRGAMLHLVSGAGSSPVPPVKLHRSTLFPGEIGIERIGFAVVEISETKIRVRFYDAKARPRSEWIDARTKSRKSRGPSRKTSSPSLPRRD